ncbi:MAG: YjbQ family protein [Chloroflexi bacterium]|nr:YjbQ family protein [Chloroflexota bacterium]MBI3763816.1 YjbQ family protein [Chloroflexota bacterium]
MPVITRSLKLDTRGDADIHDLTDAVAKAVRDSGLKAGIVTVFCPSATSAVTTIEFEDGALSDLRRAFDEIAPPDREYKHNLRWADGNGHAHLRAALLGPSLTVPFVEGRLRLGTWQQIIYLDFDNRPRSRELIAQIIGE